MSRSPAQPSGPPARPRRVWTRRNVLIGLGAAGVALAGARFAVPRLLRVGDPTGLPADLDAFVRARLAGLDLARLWDAHVHALGFQESGHGCWVNPDLRSHFHPVLRFQLDAYLAATGVTDPARADDQHVARLLALQRTTNPRGRMVVLAFDWVVGEDGRPDRARSAFHVPDAYVLDLARRHPEFEAAISVHPYREDAAERVRAGAAAGAVAVKWLPNAMGIDPSSPRCDPMYEALADTGLPLIAHAGAELAVRSEHHELGNPLHLRRPLEHGVRVVVAHLASTGTNVDLDDGGADGPERPSFDLAMRLFDEPRWCGLLYADTSSMTAINRCGRPLAATLAARGLHDRLVYGSDYPITAIGPLVSTWLLRRRGYLDAAEADAVDRIRRANPLLGDLVLHRCLRAPGGGGGFADVVFDTARVFARPRP